MPDKSVSAETAVDRIRERSVANAPGVLLSITVGMAATFISNVYGGPTVLFALLLGMAFNFISAESRFAPGVAFSSRSILRIGVALLGARITFEQIAGTRLADDARRRLRGHADDPLRPRLRVFCGDAAPVWRADRRAPSRSAAPPRRRRSPPSCRAASRMIAIPPSPSSVSPR